LLPARFPIYSNFVEEDDSTLRSRLLYVYQNVMLLLLSRNDAKPERTGALFDHRAASLPKTGQRIRLAALRTGLYKACIAR